MPGLYVHIPFCRKKCFYCDFGSIPAPADAGRLVRCYLDALEREVVARSAEYSPITTPDMLWRRFETVYVGGGTPSVLSAGEIEVLFDILRRRFDLSGAREITFECNPESLDGEKLAALRRCGATRLSIGAQSFDDAALSALGRPHTAAAAIEALAAARRAGFASISLDLIFGAPGAKNGASRFSSWRRDLETAVSLAPGHISCYALSVEEGTPLAASGALVSGDEQAEMFDIARRYLKSAGYIHYEISNFALPGEESRHNLNYWRGGSYLGLGVSAAGFDGKTRRVNTRDLSEYLRAPAACAVESETIDAAIAESEKLFLGLRLLEEGAPWTKKTARRFGAPARRMLKEGLLDLSGGRLRLSPDAVFVSNSIMAEFV